MTTSESRRALNSNIRRRNYISLTHDAQIITLLTRVRETVKMIRQITRILYIKYPREIR